MAISIVEQFADRTSFSHSWWVGEAANFQRAIYDGLTTKGPGKGASSWTIASETGACA